MKRIITILAVSLAPLAARAQSDVFFAERLGTNHYYGTARTIGMGNAVTAIGGDLGSIGINPAGSAVFNYGQVELSPGISISAAGPTSTRMTLPSAGFSLCFNTGRSSGLRNVTLAFVNNISNNYLESFAGERLNNSTSFFANLAAASEGIPASALDGYAPYDNTNYDWAVISAYRAYMIGTVPGSGTSYVANNELLARKGEDSYHYVPGDLRQRSELKRTGTKNDMVVNLGFNLDDRFYFGFNLGIPIIRYNYTEVFTESAVDPEKFPIVFQSKGEEWVEDFSSAKYAYTYASTTVGVYGKAGFLWRPLDFMRIGAAIQTPVAYGIRESYANSVSAQFLSGGISIPRSASSPGGNYDYNFRGPWRFNAGLAFTLGAWGMISADYEMAAYGRARYSEKSAWRGDDYFRTSNRAVNLFLGNSHALRLGAEVRPLPGFSIRAGYTLTGSPERLWTDNFGQSVDVREYYADLPAFESGLRTLQNYRYDKANTWSVSFGLGWSSRGSFFVDGAVRYNSFPSYTYFPYLYGDYAAVDAYDLPVADASSPRFNVSRSLWDLVVTVGWRF